MKTEFWVTRDYGGEGKAVSLSKKGLGEFFFHLFSMRGTLKSSHVMNPQYHGSYIQLMIELPEGMKEVFEAASGFTLEVPPRIVLA
ncbi:MAG: hypothetical protein DI537_41150 [Stutzerimonas stutzeri]|nr:MAG: hypothetical protein DI537_41150 [Stutzerimonas stutzeri]